MRHLFISILLLLPTVSAAGDIEPYSCRNGHFSSYIQDSSTAGVVKEKSYFFNDSEGCPYNEQCREKSYIIKHDEVLIAKEQDGWACVWYQGKKREFVGWLKSENLIEKNLAMPPKLSDWVGTWSFYDTGIELVIANPAETEILEVEGSSIWEGVNSVHVGSVNASGTPAGRMLFLSEGESEWDCKVRLTLIDRYLSAEDNGKCGGLNVSFNFVYTKEALHKQ